LPGWGWDSKIWDPLLEDLERNFSLHLINLPGYNLKEKISGYDLDTVVNILLENTPDEGYWLGWSLGGMLAWHIAIHYPEKITKLVTLCSSPRFVADSGWPGVTLDTLFKFEKHLLQDHRKTLNEFLTLQLRGAPKLVSMPELPTEQANLKIALKGGLELLKNLDLRKAMQNIKVPSLHIFGTNDTLVPIQVMESLRGCEAAAAIQAEFVSIPRAGHMPFLTHQKQFMQLIQDFLL